MIFIKWVPGLVNVNRKLWKITMLLMGKSTISMAIFNSFFLIKWVFFRKFPPIKRTLTWHLHGQNDAASWVHEKRQNHVAWGVGCTNRGSSHLVTGYRG
jgi:hypothetical protein